MNLLRSFPAMAFALVLLSIVGSCAAQQSIGLLLVTGTLAALSWSVTEGPRGRTLPRWVSNLLVLGVILNLLRDVLQNPADLIGVLGRFTLLLTLVKLYERRTSRDYAQLLSLTLVLMLTGCMQSSDLIFGIVLLLYVVLGLYVLLLYQLSASHELVRNARQTAIPAGYRLAPLLRPIIGRHATLHFRLLAVSIGLAGAALSAALFVAFPRGVGVDFLTVLHAPPANRTTGFSWEVNLMTGGRINASAARAFTVEFLEGQTPRRMDEPVYLRGAVLDRYEGRGLWTQSGADGTNARRAYVTPGDYLWLAPLESSRSVTQRITLTRPVSGDVPLFSVYAPVGVSVDSPISVLYSPSQQTLRTATDTRRLLAYSVRVQPEPSDNAVTALTGSEEPRLRGRMVHDPEGRVLDKAQSLLLDAGLQTRAPALEGGKFADESSDRRWDWNRRAAQTFVDYLSGPEFTYTLDLSDVTIGDSDPVVLFLLANKRGHCEYFASGLVALCQSVGIPARLVVGYIALRYDAQAQHYVVLERNAHAWVEVATGPHRWTKFDPSPSVSLPFLEEDDGTLAQTMRSVYQRFEGEWSTGVVGFDTAAQGRLMDSLSQGWTRRITSALDNVRESMEGVNIFFNVGAGGYIWMGIVALALFIALIALVRLVRRSRAIRQTLQLQHVRGSEYRRMLHQLGFYLDMLRVLRRGGLGKPDWQPPLAFAQALERNQPHPALLVRQITDVFYEARYGHREIEDGRVEKARVQVRHLAETLRVRL